MSTPPYLLVCRAAVPSAAYAAGPVVLMVGPPGSGRSTQAETLKNGPGMAVISAHAVIARNPQKFPKNRITPLQGVDPRLDPALNESVEQALQSTDLSEGVVLDGYLASQIQGDHLTALREKFELQRAIIIQLNVPNDTVGRPLKDQNRDIEQELKDYHREFDSIRQYFPEADIRTVDGTKARQEVAKQIRKMLQSRQN